MIESAIWLVTAVVVLVGLAVFAFLISRVNLNPSQRYKQFSMPVIALAYGIVSMVLFSKICALVTGFLRQLPARLTGTTLEKVGKLTNNLLGSLSFGFWVAFISSLLVLLVYLILKALLLPLVSVIGKRGSTVCEPFYYEDANFGIWFLHRRVLQCRALVKTLYIASIIVTAVIMCVAKYYYEKELLSDAFSPVLCVLVLGEVYFFLCGEIDDREGLSLSGEDDNARKIVNITSLRKILRRLFGDKLAADNTTYADDLSDNGSKDALIESWEQSDNHKSETYAVFMRAMERGGIRIDTNYMISGHDLLQGKNILFSTPFYADLIPYAFFAMNETLVRSKKILIILGRHGMEDNIAEWCEEGLVAVTNVPELWHVGIIGQCNEEFEVGILRAADVCNLELHEQYDGFLSQVELVVLIEPSRLIPTAQIGLNSIVHHCTAEKITFCSTDKNCDGLVDALSHILMTNITEVSATGHHSGICSYMCWESDQEMLQHRLFPNVSHYLGMGTELSFVALKNQVSSTVWFGGDAFPVTDMRWIAKQYYYDLLRYASLPENQDMMNRCFNASPDLYSADVRRIRYLTVEDESFNIFEVKRSFATRAKEQSFINIISSEYLLREYMADNDSLFDTDPKAIPYLVADYAHTVRNVVLRLCLRMSVSGVSEEDIKRELSLVGVNTDEPIEALWEEFCKCYQPMGRDEIDDTGKPILVYHIRGYKYSFNRRSITEKKAYSIKKGIVENIYTIENQKLCDLLLRDLRSAEYIAEDETGKHQYIGSELCGHVFQRHLLGQYFTIFGKYYEMTSMTKDGKVLLRRAADHINGRTYYRQLRKYILQNIELSNHMGARREIAGLRIDHCIADICVETNSYWQMSKYNDFETARLVSVSGIGNRHYYRKSILRIDFGNVAGYSHEIGVTLTILLNETFRTLFAENQDYVVAVIPGEYQSPLTYSLYGTEENQLDENSIYIIEDSQLDVGLLVAVERSLDRILAIITDYLDWHFETLESSLHPAQPAPPISSATPSLESSETEHERKETYKPRKVSLTQRIIHFFRKLFKKRKKGWEPVTESTEEAPTTAQDADGYEPPEIGQIETPEDEMNTEDDKAIVGPGDDVTEVQASEMLEADKDSNASEDHQTVLMSINSGSLLGQNSMTSKEDDIHKNGDSMGEDKEPPTAEIEAKEGGKLVFEEEHTHKPLGNIQRAPYHERYYLLFGGKQSPECMALKETMDFLKAYGCDNGTLKQARKGRNMAELIEQTYHPGKAGAHYCDFCGVELLGTEYDVLIDGRERCSNCSRTAVKTIEEFKRIYSNVVRNLDAFYGVRQDVPIRIEMVNAKKLHRRLGRAFTPTGNSDGRILGVAIRDRRGNYSMLIENGAPRMASIMTMVHEMTHIWQYNHWDERNIEAKYGAEHVLEVYEGMAKWSEIQYAYLIGETAMAKREEIITRMRQDEYGIGFQRYVDKYPLSYETQLQGETPFMNPDSPL